MDDLALVVERLDPHPRRQAGQDLGHPLLDPLGDFEGVFSLQHDDHATRDFALAVAGHRAAALHGAHPDLGDVPEQHRNPVARTQHDLLEIANAGQEPDPADGVALVARFDEAAAEGAIALSDGFEHVAQIEVVFLERLRAHHDLELSGEPAPGVDLAHTRHGTEPVAELPVVEGLVLHRVVAGDDVLVDLPEGGGGRTEHRFEAFGEPSPDFPEPFGDELAGEVERCPVIEDHGHEGEAELGDGAHLLGVGQPHERRLDGERDALLDFGRSQARRLGDDHDLVVREVGERLDREVPKRHDAGDGESRDAGQHQRPVPGRGGDEALDEAHEACVTPLRANRSAPI